MPVQVAAGPSDDPKNKGAWRLAGALRYQPGARRPDQSTYIELTDSSSRMRRIVSASSPATDSTLMRSQ